MFANKSRLSIRLFQIAAAILVITGLSCWRHPVVSLGKPIEKGKTHLQRGSHGNTTPDATAEPLPDEAIPDRDREMREAYGNHLKPILARILATPDQRLKIVSILKTYKPTIEPLRVEYRQKSQLFLNDLMTGQPAETLMALQGDLNKLNSLIVSQYQMMSLAIRRLLNPTQCRLYEQYRREQGWVSP